MVDEKILEPGLSNDWEEAGVGKPGEFLARLKESPFANSKLLAALPEFVEQGRFEEAVDYMEAGVWERGIRFMFSDNRISGTEIKNKEERFILPKDYSKHHPARKLWSLAHRYMSMILRRSGERDGVDYRADKTLVKQIDLMDFEFAKMVRLGASRLPTEQRLAAYKVANEIAFFSNRRTNKLQELSEQQVSEEVA